MKGGRKMKNFSIAKMKNVSLAALLMTSAMFTACSSDDELLNEQPVNPTEPKTYTMTIQATMGDDATRGLYKNGGGSTAALNANWNGKEKVRVVQDGKVIGTLSAAMSSEHNTTLTGTVTGFQIGHAVGFYMLADEDGKMDYTGQCGALLDDNGTGNIEENYDFASYELNGAQSQEAFTTAGSNIVPKDDGVYIDFKRQQAIVRFELQNSSGNDLYATKFIVTDKNTGKLVQSLDTKKGTKTYGQIALTPTSNTSGTSSVYNVALNLDGASDIRLFAQAKDQYGNPELYVFEKENVTFTKGKYYSVTVKMHRCTKFPLSQITYEDTQFTGWYIGSIISDGDTENCAYQLGGSGVNAVIAYVGKLPGYFDNFLAISKHDCKADGTEGREVNGSTWRTYASNNCVGTYASNHPIKIGSTTYNTNSFDNYNYGLFPIFDWVDNSTTTASNTHNGAALKGWRIPTVTDWRYIFYGLCGSPSPTDPAGIGHKNDLSGNPLTKLNASPGYNLDLYSGKTNYCTNSGIKVESEKKVWYINFPTDYAPYFEYFNDYADVCHLRPVFAY